MIKEKIKLGVSTCLTGEKVRYDGGHKMDRYIMDTLGQFFEFVPVCPEVEVGMSIPREALRLVGDPADPKLITVKTKIDYTDRMKAWAEKRLKELESENLCGYIFKSKSPSSGLFRVKVYSDKGMPFHAGTGIFAKAFTVHFPLLPVEEEGRLNDLPLRENFIERIFTYKRWRDALNTGITPGKLVTFHTQHKLLIMAHSETHYRKLGRIVGNPSRDISFENVITQYQSMLLEAMELKTTIRKNVNVLQHIMGYFKKLISSDEKQELLELLDNYRNGYLPLIVPITLMNHYIRKYDVEYLKNQFYLEPHPLELQLRNHV